MARTVRLCRWDLKVNSLWLWWYCVLALAGHAYLMYRAVMRCKDYNELPWDTEEKPVSELYTYISLIVVSIMCIPFFLITSIFKVGCYSNDGTRLGRDNVLHHLRVETMGGREEEEDEKTSGRFIKELWRHLAPLSHCCHLVAGFVLLLPLVITDAQKVKHGFLDPDKIWSSELDALFGTSVYTLDNPAPDVVPRSSSNSSGTGGYMAPTPTPEVIESGPIALSPEFVNYLLAMIIYSLRYAAVFWYTNATFSATFAGILLVASLHQVFAYCGMGVLYKFSVNLHAVGGLELVLSGTAVMCLYLCGCAVMFCSMLAVFNYGYCQYVESCRAFLKTYYPTYARYVAKMPIGCQGYVPHLLATIALIMYVALRAPIVYDYVSVYRKTGFSILLTCIVIDAVYMLLWIALWFAFTVKQTWDFRVNPQMDIVQQQPGRTTAAAAAALARQNGGQPPQAEVMVVGGGTTPGDWDQEPPSGGKHRQSDLPVGHPQNVEADEDDEDMKDGTLSDDKDDVKAADVSLARSDKSHSSHHNKPKKLNINLSQSPQSSNDTTLDEQATPVSPTSALKKSGLRKSGERRLHQPQRVTFDDTLVVSRPEAPDSNIGGEQKPIQFTPRKKKPRDKPVERFYDPVQSNTGTSINKQQPEPMQMTEQKKKSSGVKKRQDSGDSSNTPENTLTRNYRHSLRDKCGQYYKGLSDIGMVPAAQSSPLPKSRPLSDSYDFSAADEILLNPLTAGSENYGNNNNSLKAAQPATMIPRHQKVSKDYFHQRPKSSDSRHDPRVGTDRLRDPNRLSGRKQNEDSRAFSYPPQLSPSSHHQLSPKTPQMKPAVNPHHQHQHQGGHNNHHHNQHHLPLVETHHNHYSPSSHSPTSSKDISNNSTTSSSAGTGTRDPKLFLQLTSHYDTPSSLKVVSMSPSNGLGGHPPPLTQRPLNINTKPDLARRDSALPSSNETSSNESAEHMLCSQV